MRDLVLMARGSIVIRGQPLMQGYEQKAANDSCWLDGGWFLTGDLGKWEARWMLASEQRRDRSEHFPRPRLDDQGWLEVTGRTKDVIKRGGETLSPMLVEEAVLKCLGSEVRELAAFAIKDKDFGENIAGLLVSALRFMLWSCCGQVVPC